MSGLIKVLEPPPEEVPVIGGAELAAWFTAKAEQALRGELRGAAVILVDTALGIRTSWFNDTDVGFQLLAGVEVLKHRMLRNME